MINRQMEITSFNIQILNPAIFPYYIFKRNMMSGRCIHASRALFYGLKTLTNPHMINQINSDDRSSLTRDIIIHGVNNQEGVSQHKSLFYHTLLKKIFPPDEVFKTFSEQTGLNNITYESRPVSGQVINELCALQSLYHSFGNSLTTTHANLDSVPVISSSIRQTNPDFTCFSVLGKILYHDEKSGKEILKHSTGGLIGVIRFEEDYSPITVTSTPISLKI